MSTKASGSIGRLIVVAAICVAQSATPHAQSAAVSSQPSSKRLSRSEHLRDWLAAIDQHEPGRDDNALSVFDSWQPDDLQYLAIDVGTLLVVMTDPGLRTFFRRIDRNRAVQVVYSGSDLRLILELAKAANEYHGATSAATPAARLVRNKNHILKRAAILHTDLAIETLLGTRSKRRRAPLGLQAFTLLMPDGRSQGVAVEVGHWEVARTMLDKVPATARDEFVRRWYTAAAAYLAGLGQLTPSHFTRGLQLFPEDAPLLFLAGCLHESLAESRIQEAFQNASIPTDLKFEISSRRVELREAESLFRKALKVQPDHLEARIRLGRVLGLRGEHAEAETLLRAALQDARDPLMLYYAHLFLGAETEARGDSRLARDLYAGASVLYPDAQSPRLALSVVATRERNHADALGVMSSVLASPGDTRIDPWWSYHLQPGRNAPAELADVYARFLDEDRQ